MPKLLPLPSVINDPFADNGFAPDIRDISVESCEGTMVVRDDRYPGGTKARCLTLFIRPEFNEYVYASPVQGYAQVALAYCAIRAGVKATVFCAARKKRHARTAEAHRVGATIVEVSPGYLNVVQARAKDYCHQTGAFLIPWGCDVPEFTAALSQVAAAIPQPKEVWTAAGSGVLTRALQLAWPDAAFFAVRVGAEPNAGRAKVFMAPEKFDDDAKYPPPFPSCSNYDAKVWAIMRRYASPGALFWNVSG